MYADAHNVLYCRTNFLRTRIKKDTERWEQLPRFSVLRTSKPNKVRGTSLPVCRPWWKSINPNYSVVKCNWQNTDEIIVYSSFICSAVPMVVSGTGQYRGSHAVKLSSPSIIAIAKAGVTRQEWSHRENKDRLQQRSVDCVIRVSTRFLPGKELTRSSRLVQGLTRSS